jgi:serine/threonine protein kinase
MLTAIAASLALVSTGAVTQQPDKESFQECPQCGACFNVTESRCNQDESGLVRVHMPRLLAGRYRLDRRIGSGGMGAVYAGVDNALDRPIAIKVIRPELVHDRHLTAKFHHEARAAAGLVHRNDGRGWTFVMQLASSPLVVPVRNNSSLIDRVQLFSGV